MATADDLVKEAQDAYEDVKQLADSALWQSNRALADAERDSNRVTFVPSGVNIPALNVSLQSVAAPARPDGATDISGVKETFAATLSALSDGPASITPEVKAFIAEYFPTTEMLDDTSVTEWIRRVTADATGMTDWVSQTILSGESITEWTNAALNGDLSSSNWIDQRINGDDGVSAWVSEKIETGSPAKLWLDSTLSGNFVDPNIVNVTLNAARDKIVLEAARSEQSAINAVAARGFSMPSGAVMEAITSVQETAQLNISSTQREISTKYFDMANENARFAVGVSSDLSKQAAGIAGDLTKLAVAESGNRVTAAISASRDRMKLAIDTHSENVRHAVQQSTSLRASSLGALGDLLRISIAQKSGVHSDAIDYAKLEIEASNRFYDISREYFLAEIMERGEQAKNVERNYTVTQGVVSDALKTSTAWNSLVLQQMSDRANLAMASAKLLSDVAGKALATRNTMISASAGV